MTPPTPAAASPERPQQAQDAAGPEDARALARLAEVLGGPLDFRETARRLAREITLVLRADTSIFFEGDQAGGTVAAVAGYRVPKALLDWSYVMTESAVPEFIMAVCQSGQPALIPDTTADPPFDHPLLRSMQMWPRALLCTPLMWGGRPLGAILTCWWTEARHCTEEDLALAAAVGGLAGLAVESHRLRETSHSQTRELTVLQETTRTLTSTLDLRAVLEAIAEGATRLTGAQRCAVFELDPADQRLHARATRGMQPDQVFMPMRLGQGAAGTAAEKGRPVFSPDVHAYPLPGYDEVYPETGTTLREVVRHRGYRAILAVPLISKDTVVGAVCVYWDAVHAYDEQEARLLAGLAQPAAVAIENARLYEETARQRRDAEILAEIARELGSSLDLTAVLRKIVGYARERCVSDMAFIAPYDPTEQAATIVASVGTRTDAFTGTRIVPGKGIGGRVLETREPWSTDDYLRDPRLTHDYNSAAAQEGFVANLAVPIRRGEEILGVLWVVNRTARPFTDRDRAILTKLADQAAIAIANARLYEDAVAQRRRLAAVLEINKRIGAAPRDEGLLQSIAEEAGRLLGADGAGFRILEGSDLVLAATSGMASRIMTQPRLQGEGLTARVVADRRPLIVTDIATLEDAGLWDECREPALAHGVTSMLVVPFQTADRVLGVLNLYKCGGRPFTPADVDLAAAFADQAALAVANARLLAQTERRLRETSDLLEITRILNSTLDFIPLVKETARRAAQLLRVDRCSIFLWRDGGVQAVMAQFADGHPAPELWDAFKGMERYRAEEIPAFAEAIRRVGPVLIEDPQTSPLLPAWWHEVFALKTVLVVPLVRKDSVVGVLHLDNCTTTDPITPEQITLAMTLAGQVSLVVDNVRLYAASRQALAEIEAKNAELDSFVYIVSHDLKAPLVTIQGMSGILLEDHAARLGDDGRHYLGRIQANAQLMELLIVDLLALSRIGREARPQEVVSLAQVVDDVTAGLTGLIQARGIQVERGELPTVLAIRTQMEQVFGNLLSNAAKYAGDGPAPRIEVGAQDRGAMIECYVRDTGIGIDPVYHERIFEVFQRLKDVEAEGTGVGLSIVKKIVEAAGGRVWVESAKGQGATFRFTWPTAPQGDDR